MRIVQINITYKMGSTGKIVAGISDVLEKCGHENYMVSGFTSENHPRLHTMKLSSSLFNIKKDMLLSRISGRMGYNCTLATKKMLRWLSEVKPDVIHLHNIHSNYINIRLLFEYIKKKEIPTVWTLHDCWAFTGRCSHFELFGCDRWKTGCYDCKNKKVYPKTYFFDWSKQMYKDKHEWFSKVKNMTLVTPSKWLSNYVKESFLGEYPVEVINNGIDLDIFKPTESDFREKYNLQNKFVLLGVASGWGGQKGLDVFLELSKRLDDRFRIVLVGTTDKTDIILTKNIISVHRTHNQKELAEIYSSCDLFVNPTKADNFPTVNIEALACGTPVLTFKTGGSPEIPDELSGAVVEQNDIEAMLESIIKIKETPFKKEDCLKRASEFSQQEKFREYVNIYEKIIHRENKE